MRSRTELSLRLAAIGMITGVCLQVCGCHKTVQVFGPSGPPTIAPSSAGDSAKNKLPGIPFYTYQGVCTQETVWLEPQTTLSLTATADGGKPVRKVITLNNRAFHDPAPAGHDANSLVTSLQEASGDPKITEKNGKFCPANVAAGWNAVRDAYPVMPVDDTSESDIADKVKSKVLVTVSNTADIGTAVDYSRIYYLNSQSPLIGTATVDAHLNSDGTLGEGSASVTDETLGDVLSAAATVGTAGLSAWSAVAAAGITGAATVAAAAKAAIATEAFKKDAAKPLICDAMNGWPEVSEKVAYEISITPNGFKHDHKKVTPLDQTGGKCMVSGIVVGGSYTITPVGGDGGKSDDDSIGVSGSITLPKAKGGTKPKPKG